MPMVPQGCGQPYSHWHVAKPAALRNGDVALPFRPLDANLSLAQVHVAPLECHHRDLPAAKSSLTAQQNNEQGVRFLPGGFDQSLVVVEVVEPS